MLEKLSSSQVKWIELFPTIVSKARTVEVLATGVAGTRSGSLILVTRKQHIDEPLFLFVFFQA